MIVLKFGGSSVGNAERIDGVISILVDSYIKKKKKIAIVFSAFQGVTDKLIEIGKLAFQRKIFYKAEIEELIERHYDTAFRLNPTGKHEELVEKLDLLFDELKEVVHGVYLVRELSPRTLDYIQSFGEKLSNTIIAESLCNRGVDAEFLDASKLVKTNSEFGNAKVNFTSTNKNIAKYFKKHKRVQVVTGFISSTDKNEITTLGRGGSDYTA